MIESVGEALRPILGLGLDEDQINPLQILARAFVIYGVTVALVQAGSRRFMGRASVFDAILAIMLGSIMSRGVTGSSPLLQTFSAGTALIVLHWLFAFVSFHTKSFGPFVKGNPIQLIKNGKLQTEHMRKAKISENDLAEALRIEVKHEDVTKIQAAYLERNGKISVIPYPKQREEI